MRIKHFTYSDHRMTISAGECVEQALKHGCNQSTAYQPSNIDREFYEKNKHILDQERGAGYWIWKAYFFLRELEEANENDIIFYTDAGCFLDADIRFLTDEMDSDIMIFGNGWRHGDWCKMDVLEMMGATGYVEHEQVQASAILICKSEYSVKFVKEWLGWMEMDGFIDDSESKIPNEKTFREHRHDQAILTNLAIREGLTFNRWPAQYKLKGQEERKNQYTNKYPVMFDHNRKRDNEWQG